MMIQDIQLKNLINWERYLFAANLFLIVVAVYLSGLLILQFTEGKDLRITDINSISYQNDKGAIKYPSFENLSPLSNYQNVLKDKNLFQASRIIEAKTKIEPVVRADLTLAGIVIVSGRPLALLRDVKNNLDFYCRGGEEILGYKVKEVLAGKVILEYDEQIIELQL
ncbi:MAG: hypothetical protein ABH952_02270 [Candidatus Omnitrophota bacterium]